MCIIILVTIDKNESLFILNLENKLSCVLQICNVERCHWDRFPEVFSFIYACQCLTCFLSSLFPSPQAPSNDLPLKHIETTVSISTCVWMFTCFLNISMANGIFCSSHWPHRTLLIHQARVNPQTFPFHSPSLKWTLLGQCEHDGYVSNILSTTAKCRMFEVLPSVGSVWTQCKVITDSFRNNGFKI